MKKFQSRKKDHKRSKRSHLTQTDDTKSTDKATSKSIFKKDMTSLLDSEMKFSKYLKMEEDMSSQMSNQELSALIHTLIEKIDSLWNDFEILVDPSTQNISYEDKKEYIKRMKKKILELPDGGVLILKVKRMGVRLLVFGDAITS